MSKMDAVKVGDYVWFRKSKKSDVLGRLTELDSTRNTVKCVMLSDSVDMVEWTDNDGTFRMIPEDTLATEQEVLAAKLTGIYERKT